MSTKLKILTIKREIKSEEAHKRTFQFDLVHRTRGTEPRPLGHRNQDGSNAKQMVPFVALVAEKKLGRAVARPAFLAANVAVFRGIVVAVVNRRFRERLRSPSPPAQCHYHLCGKPLQPC